MNKFKVYLTRDGHSDGECSAYVDVWEIKPRLLHIPDQPMCHVWCVDESDWLFAKVTMITDTECSKLYGTRPDYYEQLILSPYRTPDPRKPRGIP